MKTIKVFISQPMRGKTNEEIEHTRNVTITWLKDKVHEFMGEDYEVEIIDSFFKDKIEGKKPLYMLSKSIEKLSEADLAVFIDFDNAEEFAKSRGCLVEYDCCELYDIPYIYSSNTNKYLEPTFKILKDRLR